MQVIDPHLELDMSPPILVTIGISYFIFKNLHIQLYFLEFVPINKHSDLQLGVLPHSILSLLFHGFSLPCITGWNMFSSHGKQMEWMRGLIEMVKSHTCTACWTSSHGHSYTAHCLAHLHPTWLTCNVTFLCTCLANWPTMQTIKHIVHQTYLHSCFPSAHLDCLTPILSSLPTVSLYFLDHSWCIAPDLQMAYHFILPSSLTIAPPPFVWCSHWPTTLPLTQSPACPVLLPLPG